MKRREMQMSPKKISILMTQLADWRKISGYLSLFGYNFLFKIKN